MPLLRLRARDEGSFFIDVSAVWLHIAHCASAESESSTIRIDSTSRRVKSLRSMKFLHCKDTGLSDPDLLKGSQCLADFNVTGISLP
jgi:hypothetical protein